jgi:histone H3/H4
MLGNSGMQWACLHAAVMSVLLLLCGCCRVALFFFLRALPTAIAAAAVAAAAVKATAAQALEACPAEVCVASAMKEEGGCHVSSAAATLAAVAGRKGVRAQDVPYSFHRIDTWRDVHISTAVQSGRC